MTLMQADTNFYHDVVPSKTQLIWRTVQCTWFVPHNAIRQCKATATLCSIDYTQQLLS